MMQVNKSPIHLYASPKAVITRLLSMNKERIDHVVKRIAALTETEAEDAYAQVLKDFGERHHDIEKTFSDHFQTISEHTENPLMFSAKKALLTGSYFTMEYSIKAAALFNPSIVAHPRQDGLQSGEKRFIMSLRAVGEGHISSIIFKTGIVNNQGEITLDPEPALFSRLEKTAATRNSDTDYDLESPAGIPLNEKVLFPNAREECMGMEDIRFVQFQDEQSTRYYGTYTAYDGHRIRTKIIETTDFNTFSIRSLNGAAIADKGMALFPEKVNGKYVMVSRQGGEMINIMFSENLYTWENFQLLMEPKYSWEFVQLGNCGSPIKTSKGWLLLTHAVGPMRTYVISAILLALNDPAKVIGRMEKPFIYTKGEEREGYVPNVVYTCGLLQNGDMLIIPYAVSDSATGFATILLTDLLNEMKP